MMVDLTIIVVPEKKSSKKFWNRPPQRIHEGVDKDLNEGKEKVEDEPDVNHLDVGGLRQVVRHIDEHGG